MLRLPLLHFIHLFSILVLAFFLSRAANAQTQNGSGIAQALSQLPEKPIPEARYQERFLSPLVDFEKALNAAPTSNEAVKALIKTDYRRYIFRLEGLFRLYEKAQWANRYYQWKMTFKRLEDALGVSVDARKMVKNAKELNLPEAAIQYLENQAESNNRNLEQLLLSDGWYGKNAHTLNDLVAFLNSTEIPSLKQDAQYVRKRLHRESEKIIKAHYDMHNLPSGLHELRRRLRWILIETQGVRGEVEIINDQVPHLNLSPFQDLGPEPTKYLTIEKTSYPLENTVQLSSSIYRSISYLVDRLGKIKDRGELHETMRDALVQSGHYPSKAAADEYLIPLLKAQGWSDFYDEGEEVNQTLIKSNLLEDLTEF